MSAKIKEKADEAAKVSNFKGKKNVEKELATWRRKLDDLKDKTSKKRSQLNHLVERQN